MTNPKKIKDKENNKTTLVLLLNAVIILPISISTGSISQLLSQEIGGNL